MVGEVSAEAFVQALHHSQATGTTKVVMLAIANFASEDGSWCSIQTLAKIANVTEDNTRKAVRRLEELGEVETELNGGFQMHKPKHTRTNRYEITIECPEWCDRSMNHRDTRLHKSGPPKSTAPRNRRAPDSDAPGPLKSGGEPKDNQLPNQELNTLTDLNANDRVSESPEMQDEYADLTPGERQAAARKRMTEARDRVSGSGSRFTAPPAPHVPRYDPRTTPAEPKPRTVEDDAAVARLEATPCVTGKPTHLIPRTSTLCLWCSIDARDLTQEATA